MKISPHQNKLLKLLRDEGFIIKGFKNRYWLWKEFDDGFVNHISIKSSSINILLNNKFLSLFHIDEYHHRYYELTKSGENIINPSFDSLNNGEKLISRYERSKIQYDPGYGISDEIFTKRASKILDLPINLLEVRRQIMSGPMFGTLSVFIYREDDPEKYYYRLNNGAVKFQHLSPNIFKFTDDLIKAYQEHIGENQLVTIPCKRCKKEYEIPTLLKNMDGCVILV